MESFNNMLASGSVFKVSVDYTKIDCLFKTLSEELTKTNHKLQMCEIKMERSEKE
jgi:hypothetical protein